jgi:patatin-like phospholipase/acyl hydrolase
VSNDGPIKILSIDGGGIRGIIPALVLAEIERQVGCPACEMFDLIAGTSTGGIIALGVAVPEERPGEAVRPRWSAAELAEMYEKDGPLIFHRSLIRTIVTMGGLCKARYSAAGLEAALKKYMGSAMLSHALKDVLVTSYDVHSHEPFFFKSFQPAPRAAQVAGMPAPELPQPLSDYPMRVVARATSAAPTYFEPEAVRAAPAGAGGSSEPYALVDGGTFANNPAMCGYAEALRNNPGREVLVVSLGTGRLTEKLAYKKVRLWGLIRWARPLLSVMMDGSSEAIDYQLDELLGMDVNHFRFQVNLENGAQDSLDDVSPSNIAALRRLAEASIAENIDRLAEVCKRLALPPADTPPG